jgi:hypothetical protein
MKLNTLLNRLGLDCFDYDDLNTSISFDASDGTLELYQRHIPYESFEDKDGNVEIYIPENKHHTGFYIKIPKQNKTHKNIVQMLQSFK